MVCRSAYRHIWLFLIVLLLLAAAGCAPEAESYDMQTDEEFQLAVDQAVELLLLREDEEAIYKDLFESFSERYPEEEIQEYVSAKVDAELEKLGSQVDNLALRITEAENRVISLLEHLENRAGEKKVEELKENLKPYFDWADELDSLLEDSGNPWRRIELMEEKENTLKELASILEKKLESGQSNFNRQNMETRHYFNYYYEIESALATDNAIVAAYDNFTGENFISHQVLHDELRRYIIPESESLVGFLKKVETTSEEIKALHDSYQQSWEQQLEGFNLYLTAIGEENEEDKDRAEELIEEGRRLRDQFFDGLEGLF